MSYPAVLRAEPAQAFDFLIAGELLRQPLEKFLLAHSVSTVRFTLCKLNKSYGALTS